MQILDTISTIGSAIKHMIISTDDTFIIVACQDTTVQVKSLVTGSDIHHLEGHSSEVRSPPRYQSFSIITSVLTQVTCLAMSNDSISCYVGCSNSQVFVYNLRSRVLLRTLTHHDSPVTDLNVSADDCFLFSAAEVRLRLSRVTLTPRILSSL